MYTMNAVAVFMDKANEYPQQPIGLKTQTETQLNESEIDAIHFAEWASAFNKQMRRKGGEEINEQ